MTRLGEDDPQTLGRDFAESEAEVAGFLTRGFSVEDIAGFLQVDPLFVENVFARSDQAGKYFRWGRFYWEEVRAPVPAFMPTPEEISTAAAEIRTRRLERQAASNYVPRRKPLNLRPGMLPSEQRLEPEDDQRDDDQPDEEKANVVSVADLTEEEHDQAGCLSMAVDPADDAERESDPYYSAQIEIADRLADEEPEDANAADQAPRSDRLDDQDGDVRREPPPPRTGPPPDPEHDPQ